MLIKKLCLFLLFQTVSAEQILYEEHFCGNEAIYSWDAFKGTISHQEKTGMASPALLVSPSQPYCQAYVEFPEVTLAPGDELELRFSARAAEPAPENWGGFRFGLYQQKNNTGYYASLGTGQNSNFGLYKAHHEEFLFVSNNGSKLQGGGSGIGRGFSEHSILHFTMKISRTGDAAGQIGLIVSDGSISGSLLYRNDAPLLPLLGRLVIGTGQVMLPFWIDHVQIKLRRGAVSVTPATTAALTRNIQNIIPSPDRMKEIEAQLSGKSRMGLGEPITNRSVWDALARTPSAAEIIQRAEACLTDLWTPRDEALFNTQRRIDRSQLTEFYNTRHTRLGTLTLAECLENQGRFLPELNRMLSGLAAEGTWTIPWIRHTDPWNAEPQPVELSSAMLGADMANALFWLHDRLDPAVISEVDRSLKRNLLTPIRVLAETGTPANSFEWYIEPSNWNAVCLYGVLSAALAVPLETEERSFFLGLTELSIRYFFSSYEEDGFYPEGINYWNYGFSRFLVVHELMRRSTGGQIDLLASPKARLVGSYPLLAEVAGTRVAGYSDDSPGDNINKAALAFFLRRSGAPYEASHLRPESFKQGQYLYIPALFAHPLNPPDPVLHPLDIQPDPLRQVMPSGQLYIFRPGSSSAAFGAYIKFGHNGTPHNHNDIGTYGIAFPDGSMPIWDPGAMVYNDKTFGSDRYALEINTSWAHSVPLAAGHQQGTGELFHSRILEESFSEYSDRITADLTGAYACSTLKQLLRTVEYSREDSGSFTVTDAVIFKQPADFETAIVSFGKVNIMSENQLRFSDGGQALIATIESDHPFHITEKLIPQQLANGKNGQRFGIALKEPCTTARITIRYAPE